MTEPTTCEHPIVQLLPAGNRAQSTPARDHSAVGRVQGGDLFELGEAYIAGLWTTDRLDEFMYRIFTSSKPRARLLGRARLLLRYADQFLFNRQNERRAFEVGIRHYDLGNELFGAMLDPSMTYTCGYWAGATTLQQAQEAKLDLICRKLDLRPGLRVLDLGCGWGNFARHAAERYGVHVTGITISQQQAHEARRRVAGLPVEIRLQDYRAVRETYDRIVSIEMIEAVGRKNLPTFYRVVDDRLSHDGLFVLQSITADIFSRTSDYRGDQYFAWILKHIFPNGYIPTQFELSAPGSAALRIEDWQNLGHDYDQTLLAWADNFSRSWDRLKERYGEGFRRRWEFYLLGCAAAFRANLVNVCQIVYSRPGRGQRYVPLR